MPVFQLQTPTVMGADLARCVQMVQNGGICICDLRIVRKVDLLGAAVEKKLFKYIDLLKKNMQSDFIS